MTRIRSVALAGELAATAVVMAAAGVAGAILFAVAEDGYFTFPGLILNVAAPAGAVIAVLAITAAMARWHRLWAGALLGLWTGLAGTVLMEAIREIGFRFFHSMPGDLVQLMGVLLTNRIMSGPDLWSDLAGWGDHFWNGAMFAIPYVLIVGGFPRRGRHWHGALIGACYGALLATGFLISPVPRATGAGFFGDQMAPQFAITVYLAHLGFGSLTGWLVHRFGAGLDPIWTTVLRFGRQLTRRDSLPEHVPAGTGTGHFRPRS
jgi:hypothetical protein